MNLDDVLGQGSTEAFLNAVKINETEYPIIFYSDWEHASGSDPVLDLSNELNITFLNNAQETLWPGTGVWRLATVVWPDVTQQIYFKDKIICWGDGFCQQGGGVTGDSLKRLATTEMKIFLATYIDEMRISLPNVSAFYNPFLLAGFEIFDESDNGVKISATLKDENSKMTELFNWRINGSDPAEEPAWRTQLRADMGLDKLFPND